MKKAYLLIILLCAFHICGCATIQSGTTQEVTIDSNPKGAKISIGNRSPKTGHKIVNLRTLDAITPAPVTIPRKDGVIILELDGYKKVEVPLKTKMNPWVWGDILLTSLLSTSIDASTGASKEYDPNHYFIELEPLNDDVGTNQKNDTNTP